MQLLIFRQDAPVISPHSALLATEPYRASGLVLWRKAVVARNAKASQGPKGDVAPAPRNYRLKNQELLAVWAPS